MGGGGSGGWGLVSVQQTASGGDDGVCGHTELLHHQITGGGGTEAVDAEGDIREPVPSEGDAGLDRHGGNALRQHARPALGRTGEEAVPRRHRDDAGGDAVGGEGPGAGDALEEAAAGWGGGGGGLGPREGAGEGGVGGQGGGRALPRYGAYDRVGDPAYDDAGPDGLFADARSRCTSSPSA